MKFSDPSTPAVPIPRLFTVGKASTVHDNCCGIWYSARKKSVIHPVSPLAEVTCWRCREIRKAHETRTYSLSDKIMKSRVLR